MVFSTQNKNTRKIKKHLLSLNQKVSSKLCVFVFLVLCMCVYAFGPFIHVYCLRPFFLSTLFRPGVVKCCFDIVMDIPGPLPKRVIKKSFLAKCSPADLPQRFGLRKNPGQAKIDLAIIPQNDNLF